jgi:hypothetical protein
MEFSKGFKQVWWLLLIIIIGVFLYGRYSALIEGKAVPADIVVFLIWIALCIAPIFKEIELPGIRLKQEVEKLKKEVQEQMVTLRNEISNAVEVKSIVSPNFWLNVPPTDSQLPGIESRIEKTIKDTLAVYGVQSAHQRTPESDLSVSSDIRFLSDIRYNIEKELRVLALPIEDDPLQGRAMSISRMILHLVKQEVLPSDMGGAIREIYSVCSAAMHGGENVSEAQVQFVRRTAPELITALRAISRRNA